MVLPIVILLPLSRKKRIVLKKALITGVTGQDGAYLSKLLLGKGYEVHGLKRRSSLINTMRVDSIYHGPHTKGMPFYLHYGDMTDGLSLTRLIQSIQPNEIYNLAAMSHVKVSFDIPEYSADVNSVGATRLLEAVRLLNLQDKVRIYQASTSELYGKVQEIPQTERTPFYPRSPYAVSKLYAYWATVNFREAYGMYACNGILFNHESPLRGETFVTRKITRGVAQIYLGQSDMLYLGNLDAQRDWGHAKDYVEAVWRILQQNDPEDYVIATGVTTSVRDFARLAFQKAGIDIEFSGKGIEEKGYVAAVRTPSAKVSIGDVVVRIDPAYFRPTEVDLLIGDSSKARKLLGWKPKYNLGDLVKEMVEADIALMGESTRSSTTKATS